MIPCRVKPKDPPKNVLGDKSDGFRIVDVQCGTLQPSKIVFPQNIFSDPFSTKNPWLYGNIRTKPTGVFGSSRSCSQKKSDVCQAHVSSRAAGKWRSIWCTRWRRHKFRQMPFVTRIFSANSRLFLKFSHGTWTWVRKGLFGKGESYILEISIFHGLC